MTGLDGASLWFMYKRFVHYIKRRPKRRQIEIQYVLEYLPSTDWDQKHLSLDASIWIIGEIP